MLSENTGIYRFLCVVGPEYYGSPFFFNFLFFNHFYFPAQLGGVFTLSEPSTIFSTSRGHRRRPFKGAGNLLYLRQFIPPGGSTSTQSSWRAMVQPSSVIIGELKRSLPARYNTCKTVLHCSFFILYDCKKCDTR